VSNKCSQNRDFQIPIYRTVIHQQGIARFGYFDARFDEAAFRNTNLKRDEGGGRVLTRIL
jgi:hypothetical protein